MSDNFFFLDTNIFAYSFDDSTPKKRDKSQELIAEALDSGQGMISYQVVQEFINFALKAPANPMSLNQAKVYLANVLNPLCQIHSSTLIYNQAINIKERTKYSWYDSLIIACALEGECEILYSEDMHHQHKIDNLLILNPYAKD